VHDLALGHVELHEFHTGPRLKACQSPSGWHPLPPACWLHHTSWCHQQTCWGYTQSHIFKCFTSV